MFSPEAREADADDHLLFSPASPRRLREASAAAEVGLSVRRRSGDSVVDEAALKWSDLARRELWRVA